MLKTKLFSKQISQQRWGVFDLILEHKAVKAGVHYVKVNPSHTSTDCSRCGHRQTMPASVRTLRCEQCGLTICRDINSAINICARGFPTWSPPGRVGHTSCSPTRCALQTSVVRHQPAQAGRCWQTPQNSITQTLCQPRYISPFDLAINPEICMPRDTFAARVNQLIGRIHASPPARGVERVLFPGERSAERARRGAATAFRCRHR